MVTHGARPGNCSATTERTLSPEPAVQVDESELAAALSGRFELGPRLDSGGTAVVLRARDRRRGVDVTVKVYGRGYRQLAEVEGRALARLSDHPAIPAPVALGSTEGFAWIVTDLFEGGSLREHRGSPVPLVVAWGARLADALAHAHELGVVHGDVKPANALLDARLEVHLADFGSAHLAADAGRAPSPGGFTPHFAAPERPASTVPTTDDDVYGLARTLEYVRADGEQFPRRARKVLAGCLGPAGSRPSAARVAEVLQRT